MNVLTAAPRLSAAQSLLKFAPAAPQPAMAAPSLALDSFTRSSVGDKVKSAAVIGGIGLAGAALGAFAGLNTGFLAGIAGSIVGASAGATVATAMKHQPIKGGAIVGALAGMYVGSSVAGPVAGVVMGIAGATIPFGAIVAIFSGVE